MENTTVTTAVTIPTEDIQALVTSAPAALDRNNLAVFRIKQKGDILLSQYKQHGMTPALDAEMNDFMARVRTAKEEMENRRKPLTQFLDKVRGAFTSLEAMVDKDKAGTVAFQIQEARNEYAKYVAEEAKKAEHLRQIKAAADKERRELAALLEHKVRSLFATFSFDHLKGIQQIFDSATLTAITDGSAEAKIRAIGSEYPHGHYAGICQTQLISQYLTAEEVAEVRTGVAESGLYDQLLNEFREATENLRADLCEKLPGKRIALEEAAKAAQEAKAAEIARAQAEEDARKASTAAEAAAAAAAKEKADQDAKLAAERAEQVRKQEEEAKQRQDLEMAAAAAKREQDSNQEVEARKAAAEANSLFEQTLEAQLEQTEKPQTREGYEIDILAPAAWLQVFQLWYQIEGSKMHLDKFEKKTLGSMLKACEKHAHKTGERIDSKLLKYRETYKAVNTKAS